VDHNLTAAAGTDDPTADKSKLFYPITHKEIRTSPPFSTVETMMRDGLAGCEDAGAVTCAILNAPVALAHK
jgi:hypothetical protein